MRTAFEESSAAPRIASIPMSHLSLELGHLYMEDFAAGPDRLREMARAVAGWAEQARTECAAQVAPKTARVSTCFLVDDYFTTFSSPDKVLPALLDAAEETGLAIDYLARESACATSDDVPLAALVLDRLVDEPPPGANGSRPPVRETGWLSNGDRSPGPSAEAMAPRERWQPPRESAANRHSIFLDVELWDEHGGRRQYSCPMLAAVWQLLRLGVLRFRGQPIASPQPRPATFPTTWAELPPITRLREQAAPFSAYRTCSVIGGRFLPIEHAVRTILSQVGVDPAVAQQLSARAAGEDLRLPVELVDRVDYVFVGLGWR